MASSGKAIRLTPWSRARPSVSRIFWVLPARSPTTLLIWARANRMAAQASSTSIRAQPETPARLTARGCALAGCSPRLARWKRAGRGVEIELEGDAVLDAEHRPCLGRRHPEIRDVELGGGSPGHLAARECDF